MIGSKPLNESEVKAILSEMTNARNICLMILGLKTGFRISELLSIKVVDVIQYGKIRDSITVTRANMKDKTRSRTVVLHQDAKNALEAMGVLDMDQEAKLFPICRVQASRILKQAVKRARVEGKVTTHSMRKTYAAKVHKALGENIFKTQIALGHANPSSTVHYLSFNQEEIDRAVLGD